MPNVWKKTFHSRARETPMNLPQVNWQVCNPWSLPHEWPGFLSWRTFTDSLGPDSALSKWKKVVLKPLKLSPGKALTYFLGPSYPPSEHSFLMSASPYKHSYIVTCGNSALDTWGSEEMELPD
jgi:hypothetical protein